MRILYAPGLHHDMSVLREFRQTLSEYGNHIDEIPFLYDQGAFNPKKLIQTIDCQYDWWIGISLGASILYSLAAVCEASLLPQRLTLINPFANRKRLSEEKGFSLAGQWDFSLEGYTCCVPRFDLVLSIYDQSISANHGLCLQQLVQATQSSIILVDSKHQIESIPAQKELARLLEDSWRENGKDACYQHCNLYARIGGV